MKELLPQPAKDSRTSPPWNTTFLEDTKVSILSPAPGGGCDKRGTRLEGSIIEIAAKRLRHSMQTPVRHYTHLRTAWAAQGDLGDPRCQGSGSVRVGIAVVGHGLNRKTRPLGHAPMEEYRTRRDARFLHVDVSVSDRTADRIEVPESRRSSRPSRRRTKRSCSLSRFPERSSPDGPIFMEGPSTDFREMVSAPVPHARPQGPAPFPLLGCSRRDLNPCQKLERLLSLATRLRERVS